MRHHLLGGIALSLFCAPAFAQTVMMAPQPSVPPPSASAPSAAEGMADEVVVVRGSKLPTSVPGADVRPEQTLSTFDIRTSGATSLPELLQKLLPQSTTARQRGGARPLILINGRRIANFAEVRSLPVNAIRRVEIYPEDVALRYGFPADQKVINLILVGRFSMVEVIGSLELSAEGERLTPAGNISHTIISEQGRSVYNLEGRLAPEVSEVEAGIVGTSPTRSVLPESQNYRVTASIGRDLKNELGEQGYGTLSLDASRNQTERTLLQTAVGNSLLADTENAETTAALTLEGIRGKMRWSGMATLSNIDSKTRSDRGTGLSRDIADLQAWTLAGEGSISGPWFELPAGVSTVTLTGKLQTASRQSDWRRSDSVGASSVERTETTLLSSVALPLTSVRKKVGGAVGDLTLTLNAGLTSPSDLDAASQWGVGLTWRPIPDVQVNLRFDRDESLPSLAQLGDPLSTLPGALTYDARTGTSRRVGVTTGGNAGLRAEQREDLGFTASYAPSNIEGLNVSLTYSLAKTEDFIGVASLNTAANEALLPGRFTRNGAGELIGLDSRAANLGERETNKIGIGFSLARNFGQAPAFIRSVVERVRAAQDADPDAPPQANGLPAGITPPAGFRPPPGGTPPDFNEIMRFSRLPGGRWNIALNYTYTLDDELRPLAGGRTLDLIGGDSLSTDTGFRHEITFESGVTYRGAGARLFGTWKGDSQVVTGFDNRVLNVSDVATLNLALFYSVELQPALVMAVPWLRGMRVGFDVSNILDETAEVTDQNGLVPAAFDTALLNPSGRSYKLTVRKAF